MKNLFWVTSLCLALSVSSILLQHQASIGLLKKTVYALGHLSIVYKVYRTPASHNRNVKKMVHHLHNYEYNPFVSTRKDIIQPYTSQKDFDILHVLANKWESISYTLQTKDYASFLLLASNNVDSPIIPMDQFVTFADTIKQKHMFELALQRKDYTLFLQALHTILDGIGTPISLGQLSLNIPPSYFIFLTEKIYTYTDLYEHVVHYRYDDFLSLQKYAYNHPPSIKAFIALTRGVNHLI